MQFEFDEWKSRANVDKHGIDFVAAQSLWQDPGLLLLRSRDARECRWLAVGRIEARHWTAVYTLRREVVRIISVRRARAEEVGIYEAQEG